MSSIASNAAAGYVTKDLEENVIADGGFGTVYVKEHPEYGEIVVKRVRLRHASDEVRSRSKDDMEREHKMLHLCDHPNVLKCYERKTLSTGSIELMLELADGGNLQDLVLGNEELAWDERYHIAMGLAKGLCYLHSMSIVHGDVKSQNVFLTKSKEVKIGDFGAARILDIPSASWESINRKQKDQKTDFYCAPELYKTHKNEDGTVAKVIKDFPMDVYSYAMVLYEVITRKEVYKDAYAHPDILQTLILRGTRPNPAPVNEVMKSLQANSKDFRIFEIIRNIMECCWNGDPKKRLTMEEVETTLADFWSKKQAKEIEEAARRRKEEESARRQEEEEAVRRREEEESARRQEGEESARRQQEYVAVIRQEEAKTHRANENAASSLRTAVSIWHPPTNRARQSNPRSGSPYSATSFSNDGSGSDDNFVPIPLERRKLMRRRSRRDEIRLTTRGDANNFCMKCLMVLFWIMVFISFVGSAVSCFLGILQWPMCSASAVFLIFLFWQFGGPILVWLFCCCSGRFPGKDAITTFP